MQNYHHLNLEDRALVEAMLSLAHPIAYIAKRLNRHRSTIYREIRRLGSAKSYRMHEANRQYLRSRKASVKPCKLSTHPLLLKTVKDWVRDRNGSPEQIAKTLQLKHSDDPRMQVSHETIYRGIYSGVCGELKKDLIASLRQSKSKRGSNRRATADGPLKVTPEQSLHARPPEIDTELLPGH